MEPNTQPPKILVVDDSPSVSCHLSKVLGDDNQVIFADNGKQALEMAIREMPDLILLDIIMPEMDGYEVCKALKNDPLTKDIPVIFITARDQSKDEIFGLELGAVDYISKSFNPDIFKLRVKNHIQLKRQKDFLGMLSLVDGLTGIPNRRAFDETLNREWMRAMRNNTKISLMMIDIDNFKHYNDSFGHLAGDDCLKIIADKLSSTPLRPADFVARYGGEEFACILPETDQRGAVTTAERLLQAVRDLNIPHPASSTAGYVSVSIGVASIYPSQELTCGALTALADKRLFKAKHAGRNCLAYTDN